MGLLSFLSFGNDKSPAQQVQATAGARPAASFAVEAVANRMDGFCESAAGADSYVASDEKEWLIYLSQALRTFRKPGITLPEEHKLWLAARAQSRALVAAASVRAVRSN